MKKVKYLFWLLFLGTLSMNVMALPCNCNNFDGVLPNGSNYMYSSNGLNFSGGLSFNSPCVDPFTVTFKWDYGDGNTYTHNVSQAPWTTVNPSTAANHTYASGGSYYICLTVTFTNSYTSCEKTFCQWVDIIDPCELNASFQPLIYDPKVRFIDNSRVNPESEIVAQVWTIDGQTFRGNFVDYTFGAPGVYQACLTVTSLNRNTGQCCIDSICQDITINEAPGECSLDPDFSYSCFTDDCIFKFSGSAGNSNRNITSWFWNFGDGRSGQGQNIFHTYTHPGTYEICLTIVGENGGECCFEEYCRTITFDCNGIDLSSLPNCDSGQGGGGTGSLSRQKENSSLLVPNESDPFNVYPNPSKGHINLEFNINEDQTVTIELIDISGKKRSLARSILIREGKSIKDFNVDEFPTGVYTLSVKGKTFSKTKVIVIN